MTIGSQMPELDRERFLPPPPPPPPAPYKIGSQNTLYKSGLMVDLMLGSCVLLYSHLSLRFSFMRSRMAWLIRELGLLRLYTLGVDVSTAFKSSSLKMTASSSSSSCVVMLVWILVRLSFNVLCSRSSSVLSNWYHSSVSGVFHLSDGSSEIWMGKWSLPMWSSATLNEISRELRPGDNTAISKMSDVTWKRVITRMSVWVQLLYIKSFQIVGYVNKPLTRFVWFDHGLFTNGWETRSRDVWKPVSNRTPGIS